MIREAHGYKYHWAVADYLQRAARHIASKVDVDQAYAMGKAAVELALKIGKGNLILAVESDSPKPLPETSDEAPAPAGERGKEVERGRHRVRRRVVRVVQDRTVAGRDEGRPVGRPAPARDATHDRVDDVFGTKIIWVGESSAVANARDTNSRVESRIFFRCQWFIANNALRVGSGIGSSISIRRGCKPSASLCWTNWPKP